MAGRCFCSYPAPFHSKSYSNLIHMVEMDRSFLFVHWNITRVVKFEFLLRELIGLCFSLSGKTNATIRYKIVKAFLTNSSFFNNNSKLENANHTSHSVPCWLSSLFFKAPKNSTIKKTSPSLALAEQRGKQNRYLVFGALCCVFSVFSAAREK